MISTPQDAFKHQLNSGVLASFLARLRSDQYETPQPQQLYTLEKREEGGKSEEEGGVGGGSKGGKEEEKLRKMIGVGEEGGREWEGLAESGKG